MALADEIAELEELINGSTSRVSTDGVTVQFDLAKARKRLAELKAQQDATKRPRISQIDLSGF